MSDLNLNLINSGISASNIFNNVSGSGFNQNSNISNNMFFNN